jgi:uncharacterized protein (TIGR03083 family)
MILSPSYDGSVRIVIDDDGSDHLAAIARQHRRLASIFASLDPRDWMIPSRCERWTVSDVAAHLVGVNRFWVASIQAGLTGHPTKLLNQFDPVVTPPLLVRAMGDLSGQQILREFVSASAALLDVLVHFCGIPSRQRSMRTDRRQPWDRTDGRAATRAAYGQLVVG